MSKFALAKEHRQHFTEQNFIVFDDFFTEKDVQFFKDFLIKAYEQRGVVPYKSNSQKLFENGRDLFREDSDLLKNLTRTKIFSVFSDLNGQKPLRLGMDQLLPEYIISSRFEPVDTPYSEYLKHTYSLNTLSPLSPVVGGALLYLGAFSKEFEPKNEGLLAANTEVMFLRPEMQLDFSKLLTSPGAYYLLVFTTLKGQYVLNEQDPNVHALKSQGYVFGDTLRDPTHPIVFRS